MKYRLHEGAVADMHEAAQYYRERAGASFAQSFFAAFEHAMAVLIRQPLSGAPWQKNKRRFVIKHFPYSIIYELAADEIRVFAVTHHSRRPSYWKKRTWSPAADE